MNLLQYNSSRVTKVLQITRKKQKICNFFFYGRSEISTQETQKVQIFSTPFMLRKGVFYTPFYIMITRYSIRYLYI